MVATMYLSLSLSQEIFELRYARMPEEPPIPSKKTLGSKLKKTKGISSESSDESSPEDTDSSSSEESDSESERANQLSYLQKQVKIRMLANPQRGQDDVRWFVWAMLHSVGKNRGYKLQGGLGDKIFGIT